jgi:hypothetical protein
LSQYGDLKKFIENGLKSLNTKTPMHKSMGVLKILNLLI